MKYAPKEEVVEEQPEAPAAVVSEVNGNTVLESTVTVTDASVSANTDAIAPSTVDAAPVETAQPPATPAKQEDPSLASDLINSTQSSFETPKLTRKRSILESTNPHLLNTLNKMFSTGNAVTPSTNKTPSRRFSIAVTGSSVKGGALLVNTDKSNDAEVKKELKKSKSKLLQVSNILISSMTNCSHDLFLL